MHLFRDAGKVAGEKNALFVPKVGLCHTKGLFEKDILRMGAILSRDITMYRNDIRSRPVSHAVRRFSSARAIPRISIFLHNRRSFLAQA